MKIALGTKSENKVQYLKNILEFFEKDNYTLSTYSVPSGVSEQPITRNEILKGAVTRARNAFSQDKNIDFSIGMEGGLIFISKQDVYYECIVVVYDGENYFTGISSSLKVPKQVALKIRNEKADLSDELRKYQPVTFNQEVLKEMILSREEMFFEALRNVMLEVLD